ncbi:ribbon-helix-helix protein, CopG family [Candidatus Peregrinibacteria bacterium]|nr:ribbon-helix-helix protein, CopG family [Candidatus Peregrinibacteria bacterium]
MVHYNITLNEDLADVVESQMKRRRFANRSEFFRDLIRSQYVLIENENILIEEISRDDADYAIIKKREKNAEFIPLEKILRSKK